jgi:hypothetical protein
VRSAGDDNGERPDMAEDLSGEHAVEA